MPRSIDDRILFHDDIETMEVDFSGYAFPNSASVNRFYDRIEERIAETGEEQWFFLVNYSGLWIEPDAWGAFARRGKELNKAHSQGSVRFDVGEETRREIERAAETEAFDPNLFADREAALKRIDEFPTQRRSQTVHVPNYGPEDLRRRLRFLPDTEIMDIDFKDMTFEHSGDVHAVYDFLEAEAGKTGRKWYFLVNYENCRIFPEAWVSYASRGKRLNLGWSLGSVRYAPGSETEQTIRMRAESQDFRPNIRNTREEALARIEELKREMV
ncbi:hypothetical protein DDZ14_16450 [Maritimibacter sp. 55A14]|uniref:hypothetical protein n=1 Tax=Maritimibacter sp. 55A14 TaxID=2174844 RepID=UPI000D622B88|nr:hypothetical protein [Maritimibacter sp. 55A14]PWE29923.1 hypothetical protein DDZ14_16450 [Maritimibacter sp. 55A14]